MLSSRKRVRVELPNEAVLCRCALHYLGSRKATAVTTLAYAKGLPGWYRYHGIELEIIMYIALEL